MRSFLLAGGPVIVWLLALAELIIGFTAYRSSNHIKAKLLAFICFGLYYDAILIAIGRYMGYTMSLQLLSQLRFISSGILIPLLIPIGVYILGIKKKSILIPVWIITGILMALGAVMGVMTQTEGVEIAGLLRFASIKGANRFVDIMNKVISIGCIIPLIITGLLKVAIGDKSEVEVTTKTRKGKKRTETQIQRDRSPLMLIAGLCMFVFSALGPATGNMDLNFMISMFGEILMVSFLLPEVKK